MSTALVLFRRDLRLQDNSALHAACEAHDKILPVYVHAPDEDAPWRAGGASRWWLHHSLESLGAAIEKAGGRLYLAVGETLPIVRELISRSQVKAVYWSRRYEPAAIQHDTQLKHALREDGVNVHSHPGNLWCEPWTIVTEQNQPYRVFTPFWRKLRTRLPERAPFPEPHARAWLRVSGSLALKDLDLLPRIHWDAGLGESWRPGESGASEMLEVFADDAVGNYAQGRNLPALHGTSRLSPHLHFGEITPVQIRHGLEAHARRSHSRHKPDLEAYLRELGWREFAHHLLYHFPKTPTENFNPRFDKFRWAKPDVDALEKWAHGRTGIPLVDAGMRELWHTGWMHNRVRMIVASFLTKNLRQHWQLGEKWFWDTLVDADLANNTLGWQWVAGSGADAAPYFRVFNPYLQAKKFDPDGAYLKHWLPELAEVSLNVLHEPWRDPDAFTATGYPPPLVDIKLSRDTALAAWEALPK